jgi:hypothetical protein
MHNRCAERQNSNCTRAPLRTTVLEKFKLMEASCHNAKSSFIKSHGPQVKGVHDKENHFYMCLADKNWMIWLRWVMWPQGLLLTVFVKETLLKLFATVDHSSSLKIILPLSTVARFSSPRCFHIADPNFCLHNTFSFSIYEYNWLTW